MRRGREVCAGCFENLFREAIELNFLRGQSIEAQIEDYGLFEVA